jgi:hypothetical protein
LISLRESATARDVGHGACARWVRGSKSKTVGVARANGNASETRTRYATHVGDGVLLLHVLVTDVLVELV